MIDIDLLKRENIIGMIEEFEREDLLFSDVLPEQSGVGQMHGWDIMTVPRDIADLQGRFAQARPRTLTPIGHQQATLAKSFLSKHLPGGIFMDLRNPGSDSRQRAAENQVAIDLRELDMDIARVDEFLVSQALQGQIDTTVDGISISIDYQIPTATNVFTIGNPNPVVNIPVSWADASADIVDDVRRFKRAIRRGSGRRGAIAWASSDVISRMIKNDTVKDFFRGTANADSVLREGSLGRFQGLEWREVDHTFVDSAGAVANYLPENRIIVTPAPDADWGQMRVGSDIVPRDDRSGLDEVVGQYGFSDLLVNPPSAALFMGKVRLPIIRIPAAIVVADVLS